MDTNERWREKYYDKVAELNIAESRASQFESTISETMKERDRLRDALKDIMEHAKEPFLGPKWAYYIREVAEEALK